jgi:hypothetical protein
VQAASIVPGSVETHGIMAERPGAAQHHSSRERQDRAGDKVYLSSACPQGFTFS